MYVSSVFALKFHPTVHLLDFFDEVVFGFHPLEFECRREKVILLSEHRFGKDKLGWVLKFVKGCSLALHHHFAFK
jgi:hypothetical protein